ncbi:MAG: hypothetical protein MRZ39_02345 [Oscillospiraceae bacterium]|nr:hypothetical protein [Oscillospiraceae bacterium]
MMTASLMFNSYKASAVAVPVSLLTYLIQACSEILVGSGTVTQSQFNDMSTSDKLNATQSVLPSIDWKKNAQMKVNTINNINKFLNDAVKNHNKINASPSIPSADLLSEATTKVLVDFIKGHIPDLPTVNPELKGYGAMGVVEIYSKSDNSLANTAFYFGDYGIIKKGFFADIYGDVIIRQYFVDGVKLYEDEYSGSYTLGGAFGEDNYILPKVKFVGDWRYPDGTPATDMLTFVQEVPEAIGTVDIDGTTYDVNGDGTVTIGDNTIPINDDGTVTVDGTPYNPDYDVSPYPGTSIGDLITTIINNIDVVDDTTDDDIDDILDNVEAPAIGVDALDTMILPKTISTVFPFCLPRDFVRGMQLFSAKPETPHFECEIKVPAFLNIPAQTWNIVIDLERFEMLARITRWLSFISFSFLLIQLSATIVKGAH